MLISEKQHQANCENAQKSTGPKTPEGKEAVRFNALTWSLRARNMMLPDEEPGEYQKIWNQLEEEFQPRTHAERHLVECMASAEWLIARLTETESRICQTAMTYEALLKLLERISVQRARLDRSHLAAMRSLQQLKKERAARPENSEQASVEPAVKAGPRPVAKPAAKPAAKPVAAETPYVMSPPVENQPVSCPGRTDTR